MAAEGAAPLSHWRLASYSCALRAQEQVQDADASTTLLAGQTQQCPGILALKICFLWALIPWPCGYTSTGAICPEDCTSPLHWILRWSTGLKQFLTLKSLAPYTANLLLLGFALPLGTEDTTTLLCSGGSTGGNLYHPQAFNTNEPGASSDL